MVLNFLVLISLEIFFQDLIIDSENIRLQVQYGLHQ